MDDRVLLQQALEALKLIDDAMPFPVAKLAMKNLRERLAQPEQEMCDVLRLAQDALQMASAPFPVDEVKTMRALQAVNKLLQEMEQS
jgi:hypothetical protein